MAIGALCNREVIIGTRTTTITEAAQLMRRFHVGDLVIVEETQGKRVPVGMVTDRDIVIEIVARAQPLADCTVEAIMNTQLVCAPETEGVIPTIELMRTHGIRRLPVVGSGGELVGIIAADDLLDLLASELAELAKVAPRGQSRETRNKLP